MQPADVRDAPRQLDVRAATGHVRRHRDLPPLPRLGHDKRLLRRLGRVEHLVGRPRRRQAPAHLFARQHRPRADQHRQALLVQLQRPLDHRLPLLVHRLEHPHA